MQPMIARKDHLDSTAVSLLLACCLFWGMQQVLVKATLPHLPPVFQAAVRFAGATVLLMLWCRWRGVALFARDGSLRAGLLAGGLFAAEFACIYIGLQHTTASRLTVFLYTSPFWVAALVPLFVPTERLRPQQWAGLACAFAGRGLCAARRLPLPAAPPPGAGDLLGLAAGALWGLTTVPSAPPRLARVSAEKMLYYQVAVSAMACCPAVAG
jgi:drug/metabolite transporter (DMT)-like permease